MGDLTIDLYSPGMTLVHRVGLGGLAATLRAWRNKGAVPGDFEITGRGVTLRWGNAREFFGALYDYAFQLRDGFVYLPGAWAGVDPDYRDEVLCLTTRALLATFLQHNKSRKLGAEVRRVPLGDAFRGLLAPAREGEADEGYFTCRDVLWYKHQDVGGDLVTSRGELVAFGATKSTVVPGFQNISVGASTQLAQPVSHVVALHFLMVGAVVFDAGSGAGVMALPEVRDLADFARNRDGVSPAQPDHFFPTCPADAAFTVRGLYGGGERTPVEAWGMRHVSWDTKQNYRSSTATAGACDGGAALVKSVFRRPVIRSDSVAFPASSVDLRTLFTTNLAEGRLWFDGFAGLVRSRKESLFYPNERQGLKTMVQSQFTPDADRLFVTAVHEGMSRGFGRVWDETAPIAVNSQRCNTQREKWRVMFSSAACHGAIERTLADFFSRNGPSATYVKHFVPEIHSIICCPDRWEHAKNLALLALNSYVRAERPGGGETKAET